jgi:hypothetical protein
LLEKRQREEMTENSRKEDAKGNSCNWTDEEDLDVDDRRNQM